MKENKDSEKVLRSVFDDLKMDAPENAWNKLDAALDKKQALIYKKTATRFKLISIGLALFLLSFMTCHYSNRFRENNNLTGSSFLVN